MTIPRDPTAGRRHSWVLWRYWLWREWRTRYAGSVLGVLWLVAQPLATLVVFYVLFGHILAVRVPGVDAQAGYLLHLLAGLAVWLPFADAVGRGVGSLAAYEDFLRKQPIPAEILPAVSVGGSLVTLVLGYGALVLLAWAQGLGPRPAWGWLPLWMAAQLILTLGLVFLLSMAHFLWRDVGSAMPFGLQITFYLTPIVYPLGQVPEQFHAWFLLNPLACLVTVVQATVLGLPLDPVWRVAASAWAAAIGLGGWWFFRAMKPALGEAL
jgi:lipopolysaccharide transport system permease protein